MMQVNLWAIRFPREYDWGMATEDPGPAETVRWLDEDEMHSHSSSIDSCNATAG